MNTLYKILFVFLSLTIASAVMIREFGVEFGSISYWNNHGIFLLIFLTLFPRLTLLIGSIASGGALWWIAWLITPRFLVAYLATLSYWQTNPMLVAFSWLIAIGGESSEKNIVFKKTPPFRRKRTVILDGNSVSPKACESIDAQFHVTNQTDID